MKKFYLSFEKTTFQSSARIAQRASIPRGSAWKGGHGMSMHSPGTRIDHSWRCPRYCVTPALRNWPPRLDTFGITVEREIRASCPPDSSSSPPNRLESWNNIIVPSQSCPFLYSFCDNNNYYYYCPARRGTTKLCPSSVKRDGEKREGFASWIDIVSRLTASWIGKIGQCEPFLSRRSMNNSYFTYVIYNGKWIFESFITVFQFSFFFF